MAGLPAIDGGALSNVEWYRRPQDYFAERDAEMGGIVTVSQLRQSPGRGDTTAPAP